MTKVIVRFGRFGSLEDFEKFQQENDVAVHDVQPYGIDGCFVTYVNNQEVAQANLEKQLMQELQERQYKEAMEREEHERSVQAIKNLSREGFIVNSEPIEPSVTNIEEAKAAPTMTINKD